jgi:Subtilase family/Thrombospondin type 3 repeat
VPPDPDPYPTDHNGHGTHVAGTIAAVANNEVGIAGVAPQAQVLPLRVLGPDGARDSDIIAAFAYAGDRGIRVVNASLGGAGLSGAISEVIGRYPNTLFVTAAGNGGDNDVGDGWNNDETGHAMSPCDEPQPNILCVGASDPRDERAAFSNFGAASVDVFAPGMNIRSLWRNNGSSFQSGTSMATPHVSAVAALLLARHPALTAVQVKKLIMASVDQKPGLLGISVTGGRANAAGALAAAARDSDGDGTADALDNCPAQANTDQADADRDAIGDLCDPTPRGGDRDGDVRPDLDDGCPTVAGSGADGCPVNPPRAVDSDGDGRIDGSDACPREAAATPDGCRVPRLLSLSVKVTPKRCRARRACRRRADVRISTDRTATARVTIERKRCSNRRCRWARVATRATTLAPTAATVKVRSSGLKRGSFRAVVVLSSNAGSAQPGRKSFRVR